MLINVDHSLYQMELQSCLLSTCEEWASLVHLLQQEEPSLLASPGHTIPAIHRHLQVCWPQRSGMWWPMQASISSSQHRPVVGCQSAPAPAPVCTSAGCRPCGAAVLASDHDVGPYILNTCDRADCLHFSSILCTYLKNTIVYIPYRKYALIGMTY